MPFPLRDGPIVITVDFTKQVSSFLPPSELQFTMLLLDADRISAIFHSIAFVGVGRGLSVDGPCTERERGRNGQKRKIKIHTSKSTCAEFGRYDENVNFDRLLAVRGRCRRGTSCEPADRPQRGRTPWRFRRGGDRRIHPREHI